LFKRNREERKNRKPEYKIREKKRKDQTIFFLLMLLKMRYSSRKQRLRVIEEVELMFLFSGQNKKQKN